jgi:hypothetical protein
MTRKPPAAIAEVGDKFEQADLAPSNFLLRGHVVLRVRLDGRVATPS